MTTIVSSKGRIVIPAPIRQRHKFRTGNALMIEERNDEIVLKKVRGHRKKNVGSMDA
jgi:AbrB family looped-hinge helix DNA binding protein